MSTLQLLLTLYLTNNLLILPPTLHLDFMLTKLALPLHQNPTLSILTILATNSTTILTTMTAEFFSGTGGGAYGRVSKVTWGGLGVRAGEQEGSRSQAGVARRTTQILTFVQTGQDTFAGFFAC